MKLKKTIISAIIGASLVTAIPFSAMATESNVVDQGIKTQQNNGKFLMNEITVNIPNADKVRVERIVGQDEITLKVYDTQTGKLLETYGEKLEQTHPKNSLNKGEFGTQAVTIITVNKDQDFGNQSLPIIVRETMQLEVYSSGSFKQINSVASKSIGLISSNGFTLEDKNISSASTNDTGTFPTISVMSSGTGTLTKRETNSNQWGVLIGIGFVIQFNNTNQTDWYARKPISMSFNYSVY